MNLAIKKTEHIFYVFNNVYRFLFFFVCKTRYKYFFGTISFSNASIDSFDIPSPFNLLLVFAILANLSCFS